MERRRSSTRAGVLVWTPAPGYSSSPPSPNGSQLSWDESRDEDFQSQMDENGIIGLRESLGEMDDEEEVVLVEGEGVLLDAGTPEPEEGPPPALEDLSCHLSELLDSEPFSQPTADDCPSPSHNDDDDSLALEDWSNDEDGQKLHEEHPESFKIHRPVRDKVVSLADDRTEEAKGCRELSLSLQGETNPKYNLLERDDNSSNEINDNMTTSKNHRTTSEIPACLQNCRNEDFLFSELPSVLSPLSSINTPHAPVLPYLPQLSPEEQACNFGPEATKTFPELTCTKSCATSTYQPRFEEEQYKESKCKVTPQLGSSNRLKESELETKTHQTHHQTPIPVPRKVSCAPQESHQSFKSVQQTAKSQSSSSDSSPLNTPNHRRHRGHRSPRPSRTELKDVRKGQLSHSLPDFSKVEPRVHFPKSDYKPPRSRRPPRKRDSKPEAPLMFKSPADIVREVLLSSTEGLSDTAAPVDLQRSVNSTVPEEFRCPLQASTLVQQLQEDYNRLLTKYAEAENTIDRLRLEAKVNLHCVSPKPSQSALPGVLHNGSKVMTLSFPQAQRAELNTNTIHPTQERINSEASRGAPTRPSSVNSVSSRGPLFLTAKQLMEDLYKQVQSFQLQVDDFENLLKSGKPKPHDQIQGLSQLGLGQDSLERAYLAARDHYQQMQKQTRGNSGPFDPERELESLIFNSGLRLEELKERIEQSEQNQPKSEPGPSPRPHVQLCASLNETEPQPKKLISAVHAEDMDELEVRSVSDGGREEDDEEEEILPSVLRPLHQKHQLVEKDFSNLMDHYQNFRELPKRLDRGLSETHKCPPYPATHDIIEDDKQWRTKGEVDSIKSVNLSSGSSHAHNSKETLNVAAAPTTTLPGPQSSERRPSGSNTSHSNLGKSAVFEKRASKECDRVLRAPLQDGVVSPETDSGFLGSESSQLTPAVHSPIQQRAAVRVTRPSVTQETCTIKPETVSVSGQPALGSQARTQVSPGCPGGAPGSTGIGGQTGRRYLPSPSTSSSPLRWTSGLLQPWPSSGISELERQSDSAQSLSGEEARQDDQYTQPANQNSSYLKSPSSAVPYRHGDHLKAQSSVQLTNRHEALQSLQEEVDRLREHLEGSLRMTSPSSPVKAPLSVLDDFRDNKPSHTSTPLQPNFRSLDPKAASKRAPRESRRSEEEEEGGRRGPKPVPRRRSASVPRFRTELEITTDSEHAQSEPKPRALRYIPVSPTTAHASQRARADKVRGTKHHSSSQLRSISPDQSEEGDDEAEGSREPAPALCMCCMARQSSRMSARPVRNVPPTSRTSLHSGGCPLCGASQAKKGKIPPSANQSCIQRGTLPVSPTHRERGSVYLAAPPRPPVLGSVLVVQYVPVCPTVLFYSSPVAPASYPKPFYLSSSDDRGLKSGVSSQHRRSHSVDTRHSLRSSLDRAIDATRSMREVSLRMTRSLASGLQHTSRLAQSYTY
ncbi:microtubule organization protein AKNA isoform X2 [Salminus brasiliensis]|uniref:microtubule organization protein AKNA isoform X2 n=1 Tax=Salminus brasiliensis TaxID=930266 RepID=UPI003B83A515